ncbi:MAG: hypothetical protein A2521_14180 [Deltaproteobacteria bacterium RIFOXYD12_FULL_57_12]|nr:MAG: hypothetical protein A2521_14180 [Deltaproteobacteria bacterium RIFOXYD12_FULL_57_12]
MAFIAPFRGLRYNLEKIGKLEEVVTPPYDVIDAKKQAVFLNRNPYNMIQLDISKEPGFSEDTATRYERARDFFEKWQAEEILRRDTEPAIYLYFTEYSLPSGRRLTRKGLVALVRLAEFDEGIVKPHEEIFATVAADRLRLMDVCQAQFSQIFSIYPDAKNEIMASLEAARPAQPLYTVQDADGALHTVWAITDPQVLARVSQLFRDKPLYIADGHHRYNTALNYRRLLRERNGELPETSPFNQTMMYLCPMEDPGLSVLPTHRLVRLPGDILPQASMDDLAVRLGVCFALEEIKGGSREALVDEVLARMAEAAGRQKVFGLYHAAEDRCFLLALQADLACDKSLKRPAALRDLDVVVLSDLVIGRLLGLDHERCEHENLVRYFSDPDEALDVAVKESFAEKNGAPLLFLMNNTQVSQVKRVADEKLIMPHKSTYFYPKVLTGLVMNKFVPGEEVRI